MVDSTTTSTTTTTATSGGRARRTRRMVQETMAMARDDGRTPLVRYQETVAALLPSTTPGRTKKACKKQLQDAGIYMHIRDFVAGDYDKAVSTSAALRRRVRALGPFPLQQAKQLGLELLLVNVNWA